MEEILEKMPLALVEETASLETSDFILIVQQGEVYKVSANKVLLKTLSELPVKSISVNGTVCESVDGNVNIVIDSNSDTSAGNVIASITEILIGADKNLHFNKSNGEETVIKGLPLQAMGITKTTGNLFYQMANSDGLSTQYSIANTNFVREIEIDSNTLYITKSDGKKTPIGTINSDSSTGAGTDCVPLSEDCDVTSLESYVWYQAVEDIELSATEQNDTLVVNRGTKLIVDEYNYIFTQSADGTYCTDWTDSSRDWNYCYAFNKYDVEDHLGIKVLNGANYSPVAKALNIEDLDSGTYILSGKSYIGCSTKSSEYRLTNVEDAVIKVVNNNVIIITAKGIYDISKSNPTQTPWKDCIHVTKKYVDDAIATAISNLTGENPVESVAETSEDISE